MPLYEYKCDGCGDVFEIIQKFSDEPLATHDKCGGQVHRLISAPALQFKGTGWYITDYAKGGSNGPDKSKSEGKSDGKSESKTEAKTDSSKSESTKSESSKTESSSKPATTSTPKSD